MSDTENDTNQPDVSIEVQHVVVQAIRQAMNENHIKRVGYDASEAWINNGIKAIKKDKMWKRVLEIISA